MQSLTNLAGKKILLASKSPRRKELLGGLDLPFEVFVLEHIDESYPENLKGRAVPEYISKQKAKAYLSKIDKDTVLITADTVVCLQDEILGKPQNTKEAKQMLYKLSGKKHKVITAVSIVYNGDINTFSVMTEVKFGILTESDITYYVNAYKPLDKAGAYGIQEWIGMTAIEGIEGSFYNVMGLPVQKLFQELKKIV